MTTGLISRVPVMMDCMVPMSPSIPRGRSFSGKASSGLFESNRDLFNPWIVSSDRIRFSVYILGRVFIALVRNSSHVHGAPFFLNHVHESWNVYKSMYGDHFKSTDILGTDQYHRRQPDRSPVVLGRKLTIPKTDSKGPPNNTEIGHEINVNVYDISYTGVCRLYIVYL
jgi:hypothetical protein